MSSIRAALLPALAGLVIAAAPALAQGPEQNPAHKPEKPFPNVDPVPVVPEQSGTIPMEAETWTSVFGDEPAIAFNNCSEQIKAGDLEKAGHYVLKAAEHTRIAAYSSDEDLKEELLGMERQLRKYGETLKKGEEVPAADLAPAFARDLELLAEHHLVQADDHWLKDKVGKTAEDLGAAVFDLDRSLLYAKKPLESADQELLEEARETAKALKFNEKKAVMDKDRVARVISDLLDLAVRRAVEENTPSG